MTGTLTWRTLWLFVVSILCAAGCAGTRGEVPPQPYSDAAIEAAALAGASLDSLPSESHAKQVDALLAIADDEVNVWRDTPPINSDGTVNALVEIELGSRDKLEYNIETNAIELDRVIDASVGGYPVNYGFMPATFSWDGDPFDVVVLGPAIASGVVAKGRVVGIYHMADEKGFDPHLVISPVDDDGDEVYALDERLKTEIQTFVDRYKAPDKDKGKWARFIGWGDRNDGRMFVKSTATFFDEARLGMQAGVD